MDPYARRRHSSSVRARHTGKMLRPTRWSFCSVCRRVAVHSKRSAFSKLLSRASAIVQAHINAALEKQRRTRAYTEAALKVCRGLSHQDDHALHFDATCAERKAQVRVYHKLHHETPAASP